MVLNGLKEGLFVIDEAKGKIRFMNEAGYQVLSNGYLTSNSKLVGST